jgi:hypothetical protein
MTGRDATIRCRITGGSRVPLRGPGMTESGTEAIKRKPYETVFPNRDPA